MKYTYTSPNMWPLTRKRSERLAVLKRIAVHKAFISRSNGLAYRSNASSNPFIKMHHPFERLELSVRKNSSAVRTAQAIRLKKIVSRSNGLSYLFEKIHQPFERLELSVRNKSSAVRMVRAIHSRNPSISRSYVSSSPFKIKSSAIQTAWPIYSRNSSAALRTVQTIR